MAEVTGTTGEDLGTTMPRRRVSQLLLGRFTRVFAAVAVAGAFVLPADGSGFFPSCYFKALFHLPCPGCGLSRSLTNVARLDLGAAFAYNPFGLLVFPLLCAVLAVGLSPRRWRHAVAGWLDARARRVRRLYLGLVTAFLVFGAGRLVLSGLANGWPTHG